MSLRGKTISPTPTLPQREGVKVLPLGEDLGGASSYIDKK